MINKWLLFWSVVIIVFVCFAPDLRNQLLDWDDNGYIYNNEYIRSLSFETVVWAFTEFYCNYWAPLTWLSFSLDYAVWGINPVGYHLTNNLIHAFNAGLFFLIAFNLLRRYAVEYGDSSAGNHTSMLYCAVLAALFFGIHPLRVESVAWATERKDVLSMFFGLGAVLVYLKYTKYADAMPGARNLGFLCRSTHYWVLLVLYVLSLMSKAILITLPLVLLVLDWFPLKRFNQKNSKLIFFEKIPLVLIAVFISNVTLRAIAIESKTLSEINIQTRLLIAFKSVITYLGLMLVPTDISPVYYHPGNVTIGFDYILSILIVVLISFYCVLIMRRRPVFLAVWLVFLLTLSPMLGLTQSGQQEMAARFAYIPSLSISLLAALGAFAVHSRVSVFSKIKLLVPVCVLFVLATLAFLTVRDIGFWKNDIALWSRVIELQPHMFGKAYFQRSLFLNLEGEYQKALSDVDEALTIALRKNYGGIHEIYAHRARIFKNMKDYDSAVADFDRAIELSGPPYSTIYNDEREALERFVKEADLASKK
ncbi:MAG: tetratricopeptide repeat protein [Nitrospirae bacterium]|nr:tetratricopeptide repeat protein [Nitrospirota bacterium]